jgi:hypothetical protein
MVIKSRKMTTLRHVARMREMRNVYKILIGQPDGKRTLEDLGLGGKIILKWISRK